MSSKAAVCLAVTALSHAPAFAQDELEQIIVTGTRIARRNYESASPIVSVTQELFERTGSSTVETALNTLPQFVAAYTSTSVTVSNGGQANVDALWGQTERGDGADYGGGVTAGLEFADGRGSALGYVGYAEREAILWGSAIFPSTCWDR